MTSENLNFSIADVQKYKCVRYVNWQSYDESIMVLPVEMLSFEGGEFLGKILLLSLLGVEGGEFLGKILVWTAKGVVLTSPVPGFPAGLWDHL